MKRFKVRLEDPDSGEFRITNLNAESGEEARALCESREEELVRYQLDPAELNAEIRKSVQRVGDVVITTDANGPIYGTPTGRLVAHMQSKPYEVISVIERGAPRQEG